MTILNRTLPTLILVAIAAAASAQTPQSAGIPELLAEQVKGAVGTPAASDRMILLAVAESTLERNLGAQVNRLRTDLQPGATSDSPNATSVIEKLGFADLLSLAIERGAITTAANGTGLTLSATPCFFWTGFGARDTPQPWSRAVVARNLSFSASFSSTDVTKGDFSSFTSGEVKYVFMGNRSPRDPALLNSLRPKLSMTFAEADKAIDANCGALLSSPPSRTPSRAWLVACNS